MSDMYQLSERIAALERQSASNGQRITKLEATTDSVVEKTDEIDTNVKSLLKYFEQAKGMGWLVTRMFVVGTAIAGAWAWFFVNWKFWK